MNSKIQCTKRGSPPRLKCERELSHANTLRTHPEQSPGNRKPSIMRPMTDPLITDGWFSVWKVRLSQQTAIYLPRHAGHVRPSSERRARLSSSLLRK